MLPTRVVVDYAQLLSFDFVAAHNHYVVKINVDEAFILETRATTFRVVARDTYRFMIDGKAQTIPSVPTPELTEAWAFFEGIKLL
ncbi:hypothetical protein V6N12_007514 [Hibiscus sabdariffa]|uniref:Uncharacterized protein n=1 Tax=Hibiscus sabdariffa TaxID=183260 RepID=A0ABR2F1Z8_9ROSI